MEQKRRQIMLFLGSLFVAFIFLSSYGSFSNNNVATTVTTTILNVQTYPVFGDANAVIVGYGTTMHLDFGSNDSASEAVKLLSNLEANGSISNYIGSGASYEVYLSTMDAYSLQSFLQNSTNVSAVTATSAARLALPSNVLLYYGNQPVTVNIPKREYSVSLVGLSPISSKVNISISALVTVNGIVFNNQLAIALRK